MRTGVKLSEHLMALLLGFAPSSFVWDNQRGVDGNESAGLRILIHKVQHLSRCAELPFEVYSIFFEVQNCQATRLAFPTEIDAYEAHDTSPYSHAFRVLRGKFAVAVATAIRRGTAPFPIHPSI